MHKTTNSSVSFFDDFLSSFAMKHRKLFRRLGYIENFFNGQAFEKDVDRPIFITGLARSGTTILLEILASHQDSASHRYRDFPFLQIPIWWNWFVDHASQEDVQVERFHKDRIYITKDSPEAMEEIMWMGYFPACHDVDASHILDNTEDNLKFKKIYKKHIQKILYLRNGTRYIAKNNYNLTRLNLISNFFPGGKFIIMVREPLSHIFSLVKQHRLFCEEEKQNIRVLNYMNRVGHFEFGLNRRPINFGDQAVIEEITDLWNEGHDALGYAVLWNAVYRHIHEILSENDKLKRSCLVVIYEELCADSYSTLKRIYDHVQLECDEAVLKAHADKLTLPNYYQIDFSEAELGKIKDETHETFSLMKKLSLPLNTENAIN